jgi:hypothetical protein
MYVPQQQRSIMKSAMEMAVMESLSHPNVVRVYTVLPDMIEDIGESRLHTPACHCTPPHWAGPILHNTQQDVSMARGGRSHDSQSQGI